MPTGVYQRPPAIERFLAKVEFTDKWYDNGIVRTRCWEWTGGRSSEGYGNFRSATRPNHLVHRWAYERWVGPIPDGLHLDHLCRNPPCVNPRHLEAVTVQVNIVRGISLAAVNSRKTHCKRGHELTPDNTRLTRKGGRECLMCKRTKDQRMGAAGPRTPIQPPLHCRNGHLMDEANTYRPPAYPWKWVCETCQLQYAKNRWATRQNRRKGAKE
jgi:hypothetical protein